eukprot:TRINITY_DN22571_c0_g1_i2.p1 TRINITY_DN22571_c0_g1~~TRINITY_DN22571_c0_g1_i2.p1  ORF type:complete len:237 (-),score=30.37 TRINITY_DN22571_c0_g1_i2:364-1074(-)
MKTKTALLLILLCPILIFGQKWDYPIKPGTEKWKNLTTGQAMIDVCQIPADILQNMNTVDLIQTCLNYPLKGNVYAYANIKDGVEHISLQFNGFEELLLRKDNYKNLKLKLDQNRVNLNNDLVSDKNMAEKGEIMLDFALIESFLSFDTVLSNSDYDQRKQLAEATKEILDYKLQNNDKFGILSLTSTTFLLGKTLQKMNKFANITENTAIFLSKNIAVNNIIIEEIVKTLNNANL